MPRRILGWAPAEPPGALGQRQRVLALIIFLRPTDQPRPKSVVVSVNHAKRTAKPHALAAIIAALRIVRTDKMATTRAAERGKIKQYSGRPPRRDADRGGETGGPSGGDKIVKLWDTATGELIRKLRYRANLGPRPESARVGRAN
jgi:hypothetical protein